MALVITYRYTDNSAAGLIFVIAGVCHFKTKRYCDTRGNDYLFISLFTF